MSYGSLVSLAKVRWVSSRGVEGLDVWGPTGPALLQTRLDHWGTAILLHRALQAHCALRGLKAPTP